MKRIHIKLEPINIAKLIDAVGDKAAAESVGITAPAIRRYIRAWKAPKSVEIAAGSLLSKPPSETTALIKVDADMMAIIKKAIERSNGSYTVIS